MGAVGKDKKIKRASDGYPRRDLCQKDGAFSVQKSEREKRILRWDPPGRAKIPSMGRKMECDGAIGA